MLLLFLLFTAVSGKSCGIPPICNCNVDLGKLICYGENITILPPFTADVEASTLYLDIIDTNITKLPNFNWWKQLQWVTIKGNR